MSNVTVDSVPAKVIIEQPDPLVVTVAARTSVVVVTAPGPQGPEGLSGASYVYEQHTPATTWTIAHNLHRYPSVTVADSAGTVVIGACRYDSADQLTLTFAAPFSGKGYLN